MNEFDFRNWLDKKGINKKLQSDYISRLKRIEKELNYCDIDEHYSIDKCKYLLSLFKKMGNNEEMKKYSNSRLPIGKYYMSTYRYALNKYIKFLDEFLK